MSRCGLEGKQPTALWDNRLLQQKEGMARLWSLAELSNLGGKTGKVERKG